METRALSGCHLSHPSRIIELVERDEEIIIDRTSVPLVPVVPLMRRVNRTTVGSLAGQADLSGDWDSPSTNAEIAADFGLSGRVCPLDTHGAMWAITDDVALGYRGGKAWRG